MNIRRWEAGPGPVGFAAFERAFNYPFGEGRRFRIDHGAEPLRFFMASGRAVRFTAEEGGAVVGTLTATLRRLRAPSGAERQAAYLGDLKVSEGARGGTTLARLARAAQAALAGVDAAYAVVMDGTERTPDLYTGRAGLPALKPLARIVVLRVSGGEPGPWTPGDAAGARCDWRRLSLGRYAVCGGRASLRSRLKPTWLGLGDGAAAGRLEDTLRGKRLFWDDGSELLSAHLGRFAYADPTAAAELIRVAARRAAGAGFPALLAAVPEQDADSVRGGLAGLVVSAAPATVFGFGFEAGPEWNIDTAEV